MGWLEDILSKANIGSNIESAIGSAPEAIMKGLMGAENQRIAEATRKKAMGIADTGENQFLSETGQPNEYLNTVQGDLRNQRNEDVNSAINQARANLATAGVRGGQAATLINRESGNLYNTANRDINKLAYEDVATKEAQRAGYFGNKSQGARNTALNIQPIYYGGK